MKNILTLFFLWAGLLCGCTQTEVVDGGTSGKQETVDASFHLNILTTTMPITRSAIFTSDGTAESDSLFTRSTTDSGDASDKVLLNLWVGQYNSTGALVVEEYFNSLATQESINLPLKRIEGTSKVWIVANAGNLQGKAGTENDLKALSSTDAFTAEGLPVNNLCIMTGSWSGTISDNIDTSITLKRSLAKIIFTYSVGGTDFSFTPVSLELCDVPVSMKYIEETAPVQLSGDENYKTYTVTNPGTSGTHYWYLPENPAGQGSNIGGAATDKTGAGVTHATCIRLTGDAKQDGVDYGNVVFTLYPGAGNNDYTIVRNGLYTIDIKLTGIDFSDKRVTVGTVPEMQDPENLVAEKGATGLFQVTTRPGVEWSFTIPAWLSAVIGGTTYEAGNKLDFIGPYKVEFKAVTANPRAEVRETSFKVGETEIYVRQNASSLSVGSSSIFLNAEGESTGSNTFKATQGLPWSATLSSEWGSWLEWSETAPVPGAEASGADETLTVNAASSNPSTTARTGILLIKGGEAISTDYVDLTRSVSVTQAGATLSVANASQSINPEETVTNNSFTATAGLPWTATVTAGADWLSLLTSQSGTTDKNSHSIDYKTKLNPLSSERTGKITVCVGNEGGDHPGPVVDIMVNQAGSEFAVSSTNLEFENTESLGTVTITGTYGLPCSVIHTGGSTGISASISGSTLVEGGLTLTFNATETEGAREATFAVKGGDHLKTVTVSQRGVPLTVIVDQNVLQSYSAKLGKNKYTWSHCPPFDSEGVDTSESHGLTVDLSSVTMSGSYIIQVEKGQKTGFAVYETMQSYCNELQEDGKSNWRLPTMIELEAIYINQSMINSSSDVALENTYYWSSSIFVDNRYHCVLDFGSYYVANGHSSLGYRVRCVRDVLSN